MTKQQLTELLDKYLTDRLTEAEFRDLWESLQDPALRQYWEELTGEIWTNPEFKGFSTPQQKQRVLANILPAKVVAMHPARRSGFGRWIAAASILLVIATVAWFALDRNKSGRSAGTRELAALHDVVAPGASKATLTIDGDKVIYLDSLHNGSLQYVGLSEVSKNNTDLTYAKEINAGVQQHTLTVPRGSRPQHITLADGTDVWVDAWSSISFPSAFTGNERSVTITGQVYFEVAHDKTKPFRVHFSSPTGGGRDEAVEVLGTHFNVEAFGDEQILKVSLLEGSVKTTTVAGSKLLAPGQQMKIDAGGHQTLDKNADLALVMAWKNGVNAFKSADIKTIMRQAARWYDIDVRYEGAIPTRTFTGDIPRDVNLSELLKLFEVSKIKYSIDGNKKTITIRP